MKTQRVSLHVYCKEQYGNTTSLARRLGVAISTLSNWATGRRRVPAERVFEIERLTRGRVKAEDLRPDINWRRTSR